MIYRNDREAADRAVEAMQAADRERRWEAWSKQPARREGLFPIALVMLAFMSASCAALIR